MQEEPEIIYEGRGSRTVVLAHGAGAGMRSAFLDYVAAGLARHGLRVARFEFPYMAARKVGKKGAPDREPVLRATWMRVIEQLGADRLVIGGKSMGGRIASMVADEAKVEALVCLGYPFHPVGKPDRLRVKHLEDIQTRTLILQGTRDPFGTREEVERYRLSARIRLHWLEDGNHDFTPRKSSGRTEEGNWDEAIDTLAAFVGENG